LGKFAWEVEESLTEIELIEWVAFFELRTEAMQKANKVK
jgi:hypothetical protein